MRKIYKLRECNFKTKKGTITTQYALTLPTQMIKDLKWSKKDNVKIIREGNKIIITKDEI